jgi:hypothetical protein
MFASHTHRTAAGSRTPEPCRCCSGTRSLRGIPPRGQCAVSAAAWGAAVVCAGSNSSCDGTTRQVEGPSEGRESVTGFEAALMERHRR